MTGKVVLPGQFLILQPDSQGVSVSKKITIESERNRLQALGILIKPPGTGLLIRTDAESISEELIINDLENLIKKWDSIHKDFEKSTTPKLLNRDEDFINKIVRDHINPNVNKIVIDNPSAIEHVRNLLHKDYQNITIESHNENINLLPIYKIDSAINHALHPRVDLPSGGYIIIEPTEALTVIDVNSGSFKADKSRETSLWTNIDAAKEIARQLKLRNIGGMIIVDFVDMELKTDQLQLLESFISELKKDKLASPIFQLTELGLVEFTRKRQGQNIYELFGKSCPNCFGLGHTPCIPEKIKQEFVKSENIINTSQIITEGNNSEEDKSEIDNQVFENEETKVESQVYNEYSASETNQTRQASDLAVVNISNQEEEVYRELGINPSILIEGSSIIDNLIVNIVRPNEDAEKILDLAKQNLSNNNQRSRRKGRSSVKGINKTLTENSSSQSEDFTEKNIDNDIDLEISTQAINSNASTQESLNSEDGEDPRRKRRRSSASGV